MGMTDAATCPECGASAMASRWEPQRDRAIKAVGVARWWGGGMIDAVLSPTTFGRRMWLRTADGVSLRRFSLGLLGLLPVNVLGAAAMSLLAMILFVGLDHCGNQSWSFLWEQIVMEVMLRAVLFAWSASLIGVILLTGCIVSTVGLAGRWFTGRNLLGPAWQSAAALSGWWWLVVMAGWTGGMYVLTLVFWVEEVMAAYRTQAGMTQTLWLVSVMVTVLIGVGVGLVLIYAGCVARAAWGVRRTNR
jgi:hypothetical protein